jgi:hypothetical protein
MAGGPNSGFLDDLLSPDLQDDGTDLDRTTRVNYSGFTISQTRDADGGSTTHIENTGGSGGGTLALTDHNAFRALASVPDKTVINFQSPPEQWVYFASDGAGFADDDTTILKLNSVSTGSPGRAYPANPNGVVATFAALGLAKSGMQKTMVVQAFSSLGDNGGDVFADVTGSVVHADDGGLHKNAGSRLWKRIFAEPAKVPWFGAKADARQFVDGVITGTALTSATASFTLADVGKSVIVATCKTAPAVSGTFAITNGSRGVSGTSSVVLEDLWEGCQISLNATNYVVSNTLTGTVATTVSSSTLTGTGTKFQTELKDGLEIWIKGIRYKISGSPGSDTSATLAINAVESVTGITAQCRIDQTHFLLDTAAGATVGGLVLTKRGSALSELKTTVQAYVSSTQVTLAASADVNGSAKRVQIGTDSSSAFAAAIAANDHVFVPDGSYLLLSGAALDRERAGLFLGKGARLYCGDTFFVKDKSCTLLGHAVGNDFTGGGALQPNIYFCGTPGKAILRLTDDPKWASSALVQGLLLDANGAEGVTGSLLGTNGLDCSGVIFKDVCAVDCYTGHNVRSGAQQNYYYNLSAIRRDSSTFGLGYGILVNGDTLVGTAAVTAQFFYGGTIQNFRTLIQSGGPFGNGPAVVHFHGFVVEGIPSANGCIARLYNGGVYSLGMFYSEGPSPVGDDACTGIEIGAPGTNAQKINVGPEIYLPGYRSAIVGYGWDAMKIVDNFIDISANGSSSNKSISFRNVGGGSARREGMYEFQTKVAPGANSEEFELNDQTGFYMVGQQNTDADAVPRPRQDLNGIAFHSDTFDGTKDIVDITNVYGQLLVGDDTTSTTVSVDSASGQKILTVASTAGFKRGQKINIDQGGARDEIVTILYIKNGNDFRLKENLTFTHTAVQADVVVPAATTVQMKGNITDTGVDGGGGRAILLDNGYFELLAKHDATSGATSHFIGILIRGNSWTGSANRDETFSIFSNHTVGATSHFWIDIQAGGLPVLSFGKNNGVAEWGVFGSKAAQQTMTDSTGGTPASSLVDVTSAGLADPVKVNNNFASLRAALAAYGIFI